MNKILKSILCAGVCGAMLFAVGCKTDKPNTDKTHDTETRALKLSTGKLDGNFNPFFYTAQNDGNMVANTQIAMLTTDEKGQLVCGQNQPTAVLDYKETMYTTKKVGTGDVTATGSRDGRTEYEFVIKNGIKFSDGEPLTIADVLFNLYVYLDPVYTGSSTIYSTDIQGLKAYRAQDPSLTDDSNADYESGFVADARARIQKIIDWSNGDVNTLDDAGKADLEKVYTAFRQELTTDWNSISSSWHETYKDTYRFTEAWQAYLFEEGLVADQLKRNANGSYSKYFEDKNNNGVRDEGELYYTTLDPYQESNADNGKVGTVRDQHFIDAVTAVSGEENVQKTCIDLVYNKYTDKSEIGNVLRFWATGTTILENFTNEERSKYFAGLTSHVESISGITSQTVQGSVLASDFKGKMNEKFESSESYSVLKIVINGIDPKAIYNFSFSVAPLHYYSSTNYEGKDYVKEAKQGNGFGVKVGDTDFFENVLKDSNKVGLPVGAGPYMAADMNGNATKDQNKFKDGTIVSFVRNDNFTTLGSGVNNAKIKKVQYKELQDDEIMTALTTQSIDFGMPNATPTNRTTISNNSNLLESKNYYTGGYGYIGINPKFVPEVYVRQAIMKAMDTKQTISYYGTEYAVNVYRPMTITSWAYPEGVEEFNKIAYTTQDSEIAALVEKAGYTLGNDGVYVKTKEVNGIGNAKIGTKLKLSFTIAGETTNHPAYQMFCNTRDRLNGIGFDINVKTSTTALQDLATGNLEVWAAAWSSSIDPDPYQVYHKDSKATSVLNWNYKNILNDQEHWGYEYDIVQDLSDLIDQGRAINAQNQRADIYHDCLDLIMELAVELPTYQRKDLCVYNKTVIDANSLVKEPSFNMGLFDKLWEIDYV